MSRAYFECEHYKVIYSDDIILVGDVEYCEECHTTRKVVRLPEGDQGVRVVLTVRDIQNLKVEISHVVATSNMHQELLGKLEQLEKIAKLYPIVIENRCADK